MKNLGLSIVILAGFWPAAGQKIIRQTPTPTAPTPSTVKAAPPGSIQTPPLPLNPVVGGERMGDLGVVSGGVYRNRALGFEIAFPDTWRISGDDFGDYVRTQGYDLSLTAPDVLPDVTQAQLNRALKNVSVVLTAYRYAEGAKDSAILRVSIEDLSTLPQVRDAVDYFDLMRSQFGATKLPADFKYSETQAEKLGRKQFAYLDMSNAAGKKRLYAMVRNGRSILFALTYRSDEDLRTMRQILSAGEFNLK